MTNTMNLFQNMIDRYNEVSFTHHYIYGFTFKGMVYAVETGTDVMPYVLKLDKASRGAGYALRFCPTTEQKFFLMGHGAKVICSKRMFDDMVASSKYNRGEIFEKMITEAAGQVWVKDNLKFWEAGDVTINGTAYQIKFEKATFTNEKTLARL